MDSAHSRYTKRN